MKIVPGIIVRQRHTDQKHMRLQKEQCQEWKKVRLQYCCNQVWTKNGGRIPWNAIPICETFKISCLMGRHHMKGGSECPLTDQYYRLEQWSKRLRTSTLNQMESFLQPHILMTHHWMMRELKMISGLLREISYIAITWNPESNCTCRKKNHFLFRWSTLTLPEQHIHHWMYCWKNKLMITGT